MPAPFSRGDTSPASPHLAAESIDQLMVYLLTDPEVCSHAHGVLEPKHFTGEPHYRLLWDVVLSLSSQYGFCKIPYDALVLRLIEVLRSGAAADVTPHLQAILLATPSDVGTTPETQSESQPGRPIVAPGLLYVAFHPDPQDPPRNSTFGIELLRRFLHKRAVLDTFRSQVLSAAASDTAAFANIVSDASTRLSIVQSIGGSVRSQPTSISGRKRLPPLVPTGVQYLDILLGGGHTAGELNLLMGPNKQGKTFMVTDLAVSCAEHYYHLKQTTGVHFEALLFSYEMPEVQIQNRFIARGADISLTRLDWEIHTDDQYTRTGNLLPYERKYYESKGYAHHELDKLPGEYERFERFARDIAPHLTNIDMTGYDQKNTGDGGIDEVVAIINHNIALGYKPGVVIIDYLGYMVEKKCMARNLDPSRVMRFELIKAARECFSKIAIPFQCPVWLVHQYSAENQKMKPTKIPVTTDAAEARTLGAAVNNALCVGMLDPKTNVAILNLDLSRRAKMPAMHLIKRKADLARWTLAHGYRLDDGAGQIVAIAEDVADDSQAAAVQAVTAQHHQASQATFNPYHQAGSQPAAFDDY